MFAHKPAAAAAGAAAIRGSMSSVALQPGQLSIRAAVVCGSSAARHATA
jgi:hypothetical protein